MNKIILAFCLLFHQSLFCHNIKIALVSGFTGVSSIPSFHLLKTVEMEANILNSRGGIKGHKIEILKYDDESNPLKTASIIKTMDTDVLAIIGFPWSKFITLSQDQIAQQKIPSISILSTDNILSKNNDYIYRVCFTNKEQAKALVKMALKKTHPKNILILTNQNNHYSIELTEETEYYFKLYSKSNISKLNYIPFDDPTKIAKKILSITKNKDFSIFFPDDQFYTLPIISELKKMNSPKFNIFGHDGWNWGNLAMKLGISDHFNLYIVAHWNNTFSKKSKKFFMAFKNKNYGEPQDASALSHDAFHSLIKAIKNSTKLTRIEINKNLKKVQYKGLTGLISFNNQGNQKNKKIFIFKIEKSKKTLVE